MSQTWDSGRYDGPPGVVTIGNFDGVHIGHRALLARARALERGPVVAYTFHPAPRDVLRPDNTVRRIQRLQDRVDLLLEAGADHVVVEPFDRAFAGRSPRSFAEEILVGRLRATGVVVGWDFRFGKGRAGNAEGLRALLDVPVVQVEAVQSGEAVASSSRIRTLIAAGSVEEAAVLLTRPHVVYGTVVAGQQRGRTLGFPTANLRVLTPLVPGDGVYAVRVGERPGVANVGVRPTFDDAPPSVEVHLLDFDGDLYDQELAVAFLHRLRDERRFPDVDALREQIRADVEAARSLLQG
jgi:riboflavin kinase/FMN adenylyltransferase